MCQREADLDMSYFPGGKRRNRRPEQRRSPTKTHLCPEIAAPRQKSQELERRPQPLTMFPINMNSFEPPTHPTSLFPSPGLHLLLLLEGCSSITLLHASGGHERACHSELANQSPSRDFCMTEQARDSVLSAIGTIPSIHKRSRPRQYILALWRKPMCSRKKRGQVGEWGNLTVFKCLDLVDPGASSPSPVACYVKECSFPGLLVEVGSGLCS